MSTPFSFNIKNDDIADDTSEGEKLTSTDSGWENPDILAAEPKLHTLRDMVSLFLL